MTNGRRQPRLCYLCGGVANTRDHVPPRSLFSVVPRNIITLPSCARCNVGAALDEEYIRTTLAAFGYWNSQEARDVWNGAVNRGFQRRPGLRRRLAGDIVPVNVARNGQTLATLPGMRVDGARAVRVFKKIVKGINYFESEERLTDDDILLFRIADLPTNLLNVNGWPEYDMGEVFRFRHARDEQGSAVWFEFYRSEAWFALTGQHARTYPRT